MLREDAAPSASMEESGTFQEALGNTFGWDEEISTRALDSAAAAGEALRQALGFHPFSGIGAAATPAARASAGEIALSDEGISFSLSPQRQLRFWAWWLTEAIPQAWAAEALAEDAAMPTVAFIQTVRALPPASTTYA
ncbi:hypothetical protein F8S13_01320 [Chloroflexia bacterium SDU3-3]|nr:hypothetical protein F8S13_01320 [Chloroflexia bacterium SDU3-3]